VQLEDTQLPQTPKHSLQQYDNYQIYNLVCIDKSSTQIFKNWLAIQAYSPHLIDCDFISIANTYR
jgi:hypothetical protein